MNKTILLGIAITGAFIVGILSANPVGEAVGGWQPVVDGLDARVTALEGAQTLEIMRFDGGRSQTIDVNELYFFNGDGIVRNNPSDFEVAAKMVGIDGIISEVKYKIGKATTNGASVTAKFYKNNALIGSCSLATSGSLHTSCTMNLSEPVVKGDLLAITDKTSATTRFDVEGKSATVVIIPS